MRRRPLRRIQNKILHKNIYIVSKINLFLFFQMAKISNVNPETISFFVTREKEPTVYPKHITRLLGKRLQNKVRNLVQLI